MHAATIDTGAEVAVLRAFGPPDVVKLETFAGNAAELVGADNMWTVITAVCVKLVCAAGGGVRTPRLSWLADELVPFAQALSPFSIAATVTSRVTFAVDVQPAGATSSPTIIGPMPELVLLPGWQLKLDVVGGAAGDAVQDGRVYLQRYQLIAVEDLLER